MNKDFDGFPGGVDRADMEEMLIESVIDGMDMSTLISFAREALFDAYAKYTDNDLLEEVERFAPHLLDEDEDE